MEAGRDDRDGVPGGGLAQLLPQVPGRQALHHAPAHIREGRRDGECRRAMS